MRLFEVSRALDGGTVQLVGFVAAHTEENAEFLLRADMGWLNDPVKLYVIECPREMVIAHLVDG